jgi:hypothetical protein
MSLITPNEEPRHAKPLQFRHSTLLLLMTLLSVPLACAGVYSRFTSGLISQHEANKVVEGMTRQEVVAILGEPHRRDSQDDDWEFDRDFPTWHSDPLHIGFNEQRNVDWILRRQMHRNWGSLQLRGSSAM